MGDTLNGGAGDDVIYGRLDQVLIGGAGSDTFKLDNYGGHIVVSDFQAGLGGDALDLDRLLYGNPAYHGGNPFAEGLVRLVQSGADVVLEVDPDGPGGSRPFEGLVTLRNVLASQFIADNFLGNSPGGTAIAGRVIATGSSANAWIHTDGTAGADTITGGEGYDEIEGNGGSDLIISGGGGGLLYGGGGDDTIMGGAGAETIRDLAGANLVQGGGGADLIDAGWNATVDGGAGDDRITVSAGSTLTGGDGSDTYSLNLGQTSAATPVITDFQGGTRGDIINSPFSAAPAGNLFASGYLRVVQAGADVSLVMDEDGFAGPGVGYTIITLKSVAIGQLTSWNFGGSGPGGGSTGADTITAAAGFTYLRGEEGDDRLVGSAAFDDMNGNMGNDTLTAGAGADWVVGGKDDDLLNGDDGDDIVYGNLGSDWCDGGAGNDLLRGGQGSDVLLGQGGDDWLSGDRGNDTLIGGTGADVFHTFRDAGIDRVTDFNAAEGDRVQVDAGAAYTVQQVGADVVVDFGATADGPNQLILVGVTLSGLPAGWLFVG